MKILLELDRIKSNLWSLKKWDYIKGLIQSALTAVATAVLTKLGEMVGAGIAPTWEIIGVAALGGFIAYLIKNFSSNSLGLPMPEPKPTTNETDPAIDADRPGAGL
jgi:hypothetical protein